MKRREFIKLAAASAGFGTVLPVSAELAKKPMVALVLSSFPQSQIAGWDSAFPPGFCSTVAGARMGKRPKYLV
jgi:hypothetical protein